MRTPSKYRQMEFKNLLLELAILFQPKTYLELGVKDGYTFNAVSPIVEKAYGVDIIQRGSVKIDHNVEFFECFTSKFYENFVKRGEKIDFIFIDADHKKESVICDIAIAKDLIEPYSGLIFVHDTYPIREELLDRGYCNNAWKAIRDIKEYSQKWELELITLPGPWAGLTIIRYTPDNKYGWMDSKK